MKKLIFEFGYGNYSSGSPNVFDGARVEAIILDSGRCRFKELNTTGTWLLNEWLETGDTPLTFYELDQFLKSEPEYITVIEQII